MTQEMPIPGWWREAGLDIDDFFERLQMYDGVKFPYQDITFSHDVYLLRSKRGEAGAVEIVGGGRCGLVIGFFLADQQTATYGPIDPRFSFVAKSVSN
jgi:hypothetical protein